MSGRSVSAKRGVTVGASNENAFVQAKGKPVASTARPRLGLMTSSAAASRPSSRSTSASRIPFADRSNTATTGSSAGAVAPAAPPPTVAKPVAAPNPLAALGVPSISAEIIAAFDRAGEARQDFRNGYAQVLARKIPKKAINQDFRSHDQAIKQLFEDCKTALSDAVSRRDEAVAIVRQLESTIASKWAEATRLEGRLAEVQGGKEAADETIARLQAELAQSQEAYETAVANEKAANDEIAQANEWLKGLEAMVEDRDGSITQLKGELEDMQAINKGLEDDKEELADQLKRLQKDVERGSAGLSSLQGERDQLAADLKATQRHVAELEKSVSLSEVGVAKLIAERDAAVEARTAAAADLDRVRKALEAKEASMNHTMESFNRNAELQLSREREMSSRLDGAQDKIATLTRDRDELKAVEASLRGDLKESTGREATLRQQLHAAVEHGKELEQQLSAARGEVARLTAELTVAKAQLEAGAAAKAELEQQLAVVQGKFMAAEEKIAAAAAAEAEWRSRETQWSAERADLSAARTAAEDSAASLAKEVESLRENYGASEESKEIKMGSMAKEVALLKRKVLQLQEKEKALVAKEHELATLKDSLFNSEMSRRALHNTVQELKGNIRVYVRVRPFLPADADPTAARQLAGMDDEDGEPLYVDPTPAVNCSPDGTTVELMAVPVRGSKEGPGAAKRAAAPQKFTFDQVFGQRAAQEDVFNEVCHLVQSALDGYHVCLFSYGQTGSGKTHTMQGGHGEDAGLIPRSVQKILATARDMAAHGWKYTIEASFLEIYNENIRDLLRVKPATSAGGAGAGAGAGAKEEGVGLTVHQDADGNTDVPGLTRVPVDSEMAVDGLMARAAKRRAVAATHMNAQSSRSHSVFTLYLRGEHAGKGIAVTGTLNLCDLAGSERLSRSGAEGDRKKETAAINKSLSCLADVFTALSKKAPHVPFRNSKLTHLLQPCFRGDGKTLMVVNVSPTVTSASETQCSLRFAAQVSQVELSKTKKRTVEALPDATPAPASAPAAAAPATSSFRPAAASAAAKPTPAAAPVTAAPAAYVPVTHVTVAAASAASAMDTSAVSLGDLDASHFTAASGGYALDTSLHLGEGEGEEEGAAQGDNGDGDDEEDEDALEEALDMHHLATTANGSFAHAGQKRTLAQTATASATATATATAAAPAPTRGVVPPPPAKRPATAATMSASKAIPGSSGATGSAASSRLAASSSSAMASARGGAGGAGGAGGPPPMRKPALPSTMRR